MSVILKLFHVEQFRSSCLAVSGARLHRRGGNRGGARGGRHRRHRPRSARARSRHRQHPGRPPRRSGGIRRDTHQVRRLHPPRTDGGRPAPTARGRATDSMSVILKLFHVEQFRSSCLAVSGARLHRREVVDEHDERLTPLAHAIGLADERRMQRLREKIGWRDAIVTLAAEHSVRAADINPTLEACGESPLQQGVKLQSRILDLMYSMFYCAVNCLILCLLF